MQLYFLFYVLPDAGLLLPPLLAGVIGLGVHYSTYMSEVFRAGVENVNRGQWEAAKACNLTATQTWRHVILPQAIPPIIPALANYVVAMFKETPLLSVITVVELMAQARGVASTNFRYLEPMTLVGGFFLLISVAAVLIIRQLERKLIGKVKTLRDMKAIGRRGNCNGSISIEVEAIVRQPLQYSMLAGSGSACNRVAMRSRPWRKS